MRYNLVMAARRSGVYFLVFACCTCVLFRPFPAYAQTTAPADLASKLNTRFTTCDMSGLNFVEALIHVAQTIEIPMGISWVNTPAARAKMVLLCNDLTAQQLLEKIVYSQSHYQMQVSSGVVHVFSTDIPVSQNFLFLQLPEFQAQGLINSVKVALWMQLNQIIQSTTRGYAASIFSNPDEPRLEVSLRNAAVADIFDSLAIASDRKIWVVTFDDSSTLIRSGFRRTRSLTAKKAMSDDEQPAWDIIGWNGRPLMYFEIPDAP